MLMFLTLLFTDTAEKSVSTMLFVLQLGNFLASEKENNGNIILILI